MAQMTKEQKKSALICNVCGRALHVEKGILVEDAFQATKEWGFFSSRDLEIHKFTMCESCYDHMISQFKIPIEVSEKKEVL